MAEIRATPQQRAAAEDRGGALLVAAVPVKQKFWLTG